MRPERLLLAANHISRSRLIKAMMILRTNVSVRLFQGNRGLAPHAIYFGVLPVGVM